MWTIQYCQRYTANTKMGANGLLHLGHITSDMPLIGIINNMTKVAKHCFVYSR